MKKEKVENKEVDDIKINGKKKQILLFTLLLILFITIIIGIILFFIYKIPSKYYGTYIRYNYYDGLESKTIYKISPFRIKYKHEYLDNGKKKTLKNTYKYYKKKDDLILNMKDGDNYIIINDDRLYLSSSKDISFKEKYEDFYFNIKSDKADLYKISSKSDDFESTLENSVNLWTKEIIYTGYESEMNEDKFYILKSDKKGDDTNLNTYEIKFDACNGTLSLFYDRKNQSLKEIDFSGSVLITKYSGTIDDSMDLNDIYDSQAMLLASMYILGNTKNIELNLDIDLEGNDNDFKDLKNYNKKKNDLNYRQNILNEYNELMDNKIIDNIYDDRITYSLNKDLYSINYTNWITKNDYSISGIISWNIKLNN